MTALKEESASKRYPLHRYRTSGGPCKTLKLGDPLPKYVRLGALGRYVLDSNLKLPRHKEPMVGYRWEAPSAQETMDMDNG